MSGTPSIRASHGLKARGGRQSVARAKRCEARTALDELVSCIVNACDPDQVIIFGSRARGDAGPDSDIDLLVVVPFEGSKHEKQVEILGALPAAAAPVDVIVTRPEDFRWRKDIVGTIEWPASHEGRVLYARS